MVKRKTTKRASGTKERDSIYFLKLVLYVILGSQWLYIASQSSGQQLPLPLGFLIGLFFARHEHFQIDRKIEYAVLLVAMFIGFWLPMGIKIIR